MKRFAVCVIIAVALSATRANAGSVSVEPHPAKSLLDDDRAVVASLVSDAVSEIRLCALAFAKAHDPAIVSLCRTSSTDSSRMAIAGMQLAQRIGATAAKLQPLEQTPGQIDSLSQLSGHEFDRTFLLGQIEVSEDAWNETRYALEVAAEPAVKRYERSVLDTVVKRLELAENALHDESLNEP